MFRPARIPRLSQALVSRVSRVSHARGVAGTTPQLPEHALGSLPTSTSPITSKLHFFNSVMSGEKKIPTYRVIDGAGQPIEGAEVPEIDKALALKMYEHMVLLPIMDETLYNLQRQGRISFYITSFGEEAAVIGSGAALAPDDEVLAQYRESGALLFRGFTLDDIMNQCFGTYLDSSGKGKQMPAHYGSKKLHWHTISSPLATQIPQAAGVGYAIKRDPNRRGKNCAVVYFGEGAASEGDFHAGLALASTIPTPTLFIARNNGFAISTPSTEQFYGDGIASRGPGYGVHTIRVDGNDVLAVFAAVKEARRRCIDEGRAVLVETMTYRVGHHSTSDDSFAYRPRKEVEDRKRLDNPIVRFRLFLESRGWWSKEEETALVKRLRDEVNAAYKRAEKLPKPPVEEMFSEVYGGEMPWNLKEQREELRGLIKKYGQTWEPWKSELKKHKGEGKEFLG
ncbi:branched-chain alpha-keto acid dehydrogenase E1-alpha subunit [Dichomitus squalens]|uniref:2-oxoisovalerate dehydrogenase subunit alpha n=1 Tax=Dichomitus squalens TaxID=114155 RepID=A0A4V2JZ09_9APHY|nr:branched-chain alpha-keto acid dehydrogenase E1-alpha subunit [Dichomitus squalens]